MASKQLFQSHRKVITPYNTKNDAQGDAYSMDAAHKLCQFVATNCFGGTYYASASDQLKDIQQLVVKVESELIAKAAVYGREQANMKDMPAYLCAVLAARKETVLLGKVFPRVITNMKMLCNFVQIIRSGVTGRKSFGTSVKRLIQNWLVGKSGNALFDASIGHSDPSLKDIIKMVHPKAKNAEQNNLFRYLLDNDYELNVLPPKARMFEVFKKDNTQPIPEVDFRVLTNFNLNVGQWQDIGRAMPWNALRMNLNNLARKDVFKDGGFVNAVAAKLADKEQVKKFNVFPYQLMTAYQNAQDLPQKVTNALQDALDVAVNNIPSVDCEVAVCVDLSGSMQTPITGGNRAVVSKTLCSHVAGLIASAFLSKNEGIVIGFGDTAKQIKINPRDSVMTNAKLCCENNGVGYGTNIGSCLSKLNDMKSKAELIIIATDCQSWHGASVTSEWKKYKSRVKKAKLVYIDLQANGTLQELDSNDVLNVGGFSDSVFDVIALFVKNGGSGNHFTDIVNQVTL